MAARGPSPSLSMAPYSQGGGSGDYSDSFRTRGYNRSEASSGPSSREHPVVGRVDCRGGGGLELRGSGSFKARYHNQYQGPAKREFERVSGTQQQEQFEADGAAIAADGPTHESSVRMGGQNSSFGSEGGDSREQLWLSNRGGHLGRVQGVFPDDDGPEGAASSALCYAITLSGGQGQGGSEAPQPQRQENGCSGGHHRQHNNGYGGIQRQENGHGGGYEGQGGYRRTTSQGASSRGRPSMLDERGGAGALWISPGRVSTESVFGDSGELQTFGSPSSLRRTVKAAATFFRSPKDEGKLQWGMNYDARISQDGGGRSYKGLRDGDLMRSFTNEGVDRGDGWGSNCSSNGGHLDNSHTHIRRESVNVNKEAHQMGGIDGGVQMHKRRDQAQSIRGGEQGQRIQVPLSSKRDEEFVNPTTKSLKGSSRKVSFDAGCDLSGELPVLSPSSFSKGIFSRINSLDRKKGFLGRMNSVDRTKGILSRMNSLDRKAKREKSPQLPVFSSSSEAKPDIKRESSLDKLSRERSLSKSASKGPGLEGGERWNATTESAVFSLSSAKERSKQEINNPKRTWLHERIVKRDPVDIAQSNFSTGQRNADSGGGRQGLFTPWTTLQQSVSKVRTKALCAPRSKSFHEVENSSREPRDGQLKHENLRVTLSGGQQRSGRGRRTVTSADPDEAENWRPEPKASRDHSKDSARSKPLHEMTTTRPEKRWSGDYSRDGVRPESLKEFTPNWRPERRASRDYSKDVVRPESLQESTPNWRLERSKTASLF